MLWLDTVMAFVRQIPVHGTPEDDLDLPTWEARLLGVLVAAESQGRSADKALEWWRRDGVLLAFLVALSQGLRTAGLHLSGEEAMECGLQRAILGDDARPPPSLQGSRVQERLFAEVVMRSSKDASAHPMNAPPRWVSEHLLENGLIQRSPSGWALTESGRVLRDLVGEAARRWLLHVEVQQSMGPFDDHRVHSSLLRMLLRGRIDIEYHPSCPEEDWPGSEKALRRLAGMEIIDLDDLGGASCRLREEHRPLLEELVADPPVPLAILADSLVRDRRDRSFEPWLGHRGPDRAAENLLTARMVAHEVRNVVVPLRTLLRRLAEDPARQEQHRARMEEGLSRLLAFAEEQLRVASLGLGPRAPFALQDAIQEAIHLTSLERNSRVTVVVAPGLPAISLSGVREHFVSVLVNLIRNAASSRPTGLVQITFRGAQGEDDLRLMIDDDGPGVPTELRDRIFEQGFSLHGSSGQGLSIARAWLRDMRAEISCGESPDGGARFTLDLPLLERTP